MSCCTFSLTMRICIIYLQHLSFFFLFFFNFSCSLSNQNRKTVWMENKYHCHKIPFCIVKKIRVDWSSNWLCIAHTQMKYFRFGCPVWSIYSMAVGRTHVCLCSNWARNLLQHNTHMSARTHTHHDGVWISGNGKRNQERMEDWLDEWERKQS